MGERKTIWALLAACVQQLPEPFQARDIVAWFRRHHPGVNEASLRAHIQSATSNVAPQSKIHGFVGRRPLITRVDHGTYIRYRGPVAGAPASAEPPVSSPEGDTGNRASGSAREAAPDVILIACSDRKANKPLPVRELYVGDHFFKAKSYAESRGVPWFVLSGRWGLLRPDDVIRPYDLYLGDQDANYRQVWGMWVASQLRIALPTLAGIRLEMHAGQTYVEPIREPLSLLGAVLIEPLRGLRQGEQLRWYGEQRTTSPAAPEPETHPKREMPPPMVASEVRVVDRPREAGPFSYRWPESTEQFDRSWEMRVESGGLTYTVRHALGERHVYGRRRQHSVTFVNGSPEVEGVAADDYVDSRRLLSPLKGSDRRLIRLLDDVPNPYAAFELVDHRSELDAPYSRDALAVKLAEHDVLGWARYALARRAVRAEAQATSKQREAPAVRETPAHDPSAEPFATRPPLARPITPEQRKAVVEALLELGRSGLNEDYVGSSSFTPNPEANQLLRDDPFAFLLGVLFDQGIPAERAWEAPYELRERLGHLEPARIAASLPEVQRAIGRPPKLHRYIEKMPVWVVAAACNVVHQYGRDAGAIWRGSPSARQVQNRLLAFPGIGQKKAAMAVEILERDLGVPIIGMEESDIAYDVHVRRVFLRTGLAQYDDLDHMVEVARFANPERPGEIDLPAWYVGRNWCRAGVPRCGACALGNVCPKDIGAASRVRGA